jgi:hypothetical protein
MRLKALATFVNLQEDDFQAQYSTTLMELQTMKRLTIETPKALKNAIWFQMSCAG